MFWSLGRRKQSKISFAKLVSNRNTETSRKKRRTVLLNNKTTANMLTRQFIFGLLSALALFALACNAQGEYDDDNYGNQGGGNGQDDDNYGNSYNNDDGYNNQPAPNYQQNVDSDGSNSSPNSYSPQGASDANGDYEDDENSAASAPAKTVVAAPQRIKRSASSTEQDKKQPEQAAAESAPKLRVKRHGKYYIGPVYTYVKTDKHANFKWGVKHKVGKKHYG